MGKTPTASPGTAGQPHQVTQYHHIGSTPLHTGNRLDSHQCQKGTSNQSHHGHGAQLAHQCNRHWSLCHPGCQAHLAPGQSTNLGRAPRPTLGGLVRDTHTKPPKCRSRVGRGASWKQRHLSQIGEGVRQYTEIGVCVSLRCTREYDGTQCSLTQRTVCVSVRCTHDDDGMLCSFFFQLLIVIFVSYFCLPPTDRHSVKRATPNP